MRRTIFSLFLLLIISNVWAVQAQGNVVDVIESRDEFSTLAQALSLADPSIREELASGRAYTVLAPTNVAFVNVANFLEVPLEDLLSNTPVLNQLLQYHVIRGTNFTAQLRQLDGQVVPTLLEQAFIGISQSPNGTISFNRIADLIQPDLTASNGVVHGIDQVLLNRVITNTLEEQGVEAALSPLEDDNTNANTDETTPETPTQTEMPEDTVTANLRIANFSTDALTVSIGGFTTYENLALGDITTYEQMVAETGDISLTPSSLALPEDFTLALNENSYTTLVLTGSDPITPVSIRNNFAGLSDTDARITIFNTLNSPVTVKMDDFILTRLTVNDSITMDVQLENYLSRLMVEVTVGDTVISLPLTTLNLSNSRYYLAVLTNEADPTFVVAATNADATPVTSDVMDVSTSDDTAEALSQDNLLDVISMRNELSILASAVDAASPSIQEILNGTDQYTVLAPSNQAFRNLLTTAGVSQTQLLARTDILDQILLYHILNDVVMAADLRSQNGGSTSTLLPRGAIGIFVTDADVIYLNRVVSVTEEDIMVSNGVLHIIDNMLLPQAALDALGL